MPLWNNSRNKINRVVTFTEIYGSYKGKVPGGYQYTIYDEQNGWFDIGQSTWISWENIKLIK
jgi:hypothetical protein